MRNLQNLSQIIMSDLEVEMEVKLNREVRDYTEAIFFGLSFRQFVFSLLAILVAVGVFFPMSTS